jgi:hypothetical protein
MHMEKIVLRYIKTFLGYGHSKGQFQFWGMEEGGGDNPEQVKKRFRVWNKNGRRPTEDLIKFQPRIGIKDWFVLPENPKPKPQPTWQGLIRIFLNAQGVEVTSERILKFQTKKLGRKKNRKSPCLFELMPLPAPRQDKHPCNWLAKKYPKLKFLNNRKDYNNCVLPTRLKISREHILKSEPKVVCFYGKSYLRHWEKIVKKIGGTEFKKKEIGNKHFYYARQNGTLFIACFHPAPSRRPPPPNSYFDSIGEFIRRKLLNTSRH